MAGVEATGVPKLRRRRDAFANAARHAALALLAERGYANFSLADVAVTAGIHRASLYRRWPTKSALVADAIATAIPVSPGDALSAHGGRLEELARALARFIESPVGRAVVRLLLALPDDLELEAATRNAWTELMGGAPGEAGVDPELPLAQFTVAGAILHRVFVERQSVTDRYIAALVRSVQPLGPDTVETSPNLAEIPPDNQGP